MRTGFKGCIRDVESEDEDLREKPLDLTVSLADTQDPVRVFYNVKKCGCKDQTCQNDGTCEPREDDFRCECPLGFTGPQCQIQSEISLEILDRTREMFLKFCL